MTAIASVSAWEVLDSRGNPTVRAEVRLASGAAGRATAPSGASTGRREAHELRDGDSTRFNGRGVLRAVDNVNRILGPALVGQEASSQSDVDALMCTLDGSPAKERLGANAIVAVSLAVAHATAAERGLSLFQYLGGAQATMLPVPLLNVVNGGQHALDGVDFQEFMIVPLGAPTFAEALRWATETYHALEALLREQGLPTSVGDEGGFAPRLARNEEALDLLVRAMERAGYQPGDQMGIALDPAASGFYQDGRYQLVREGAILSSEELIDRYSRWIEQYPIVSIEDGLAEDDWDGWELLSRQLGSRVQLVGDDIFVTNPSIIAQGISRKVANAVLIKPNQIGSLTETRQAIELTRSAGWQAVVSHRSGETDDASIADLAVGYGCRQIKAGAPARGERLAKYNRLLEIARELGDAGAFAGRTAFAHLGKPPSPPRRGRGWE
jgi:enolase